MIVLDEWTNSDSEPKQEIPVKTEPKIIDQNCFQDKQQPDSGSGKQPEIKKEPKMLSLVKTEPKIIDQNCFQDKQQPDSGKQPEIKKEPVEELEPESNLPIKMNKGFVFPKPVPSVIPVIKNEPLLEYTTT
jgi:hypothetical protein